MRRPIHSFFIPVTERHPEGGWQPAADIYQCSYGWLIKYDLAGVQPGDIRLTAQGCCLTITGIRRDLSIGAGQAYSMEIAYNRFERSIELPCNLDQASIQTEYRDGMFLVSLRTGEHP
jgi:Molecular chaperone (small heat shock protein)